MQVKRDIGGAGTGKTTRAIQALERAMERPEVDHNPFALGFSSFTRAARAEAAGRAGKAWNMDPADLEKNGWFKTVHSIAHGALGVQKGQMITSTAEDEKWLAEAVQSDVSYQQSDEEGVSVYVGDKTASMSLNYWAFARNVGKPLREVVESDDTPDRPPFDDVVEKVNLYEAAKRFDNRTDFTDLLCRFAGVSFNDEYEPVRVSPEGPVPAGVVGWIFDEAQDATWLLDQCCRRVVNTDACKWVMMLGDPWQVLYNWAGSSASHFMGWEAIQTVMPKSYRCPAPILALGERCLQDLPDYWDRGIAPADHEGSIEEIENYEDALESLDPSVDTLVITRRNRTAKHVASILDDLGVPHRSIKSSGDPTQRALGLAGLWNLQRGQGISGAHWGYILDLLPSRSLTGGHAWLTRGTKSQWEKGLSATFDRVYPEDLDRLGATEQLRNVIAAGQWAELIDGGQKWYRAATRFGVDAVTRPKVRIGTIHASKGMEGSTVVLLTSVGKMITEGCEISEAKRNEERRLEYVACTRARHKLIVTHDPRERYRMELPL